MLGNSLFDLFTYIWVNLGYVLSQTSIWIKLKRKQVKSHINYIQRHKTTTTVFLNVTLYCTDIVVVIISY